MCDVKVTSLYVVDILSRSNGRDIEGEIESPVNVGVKDVLLADRCCSPVSLPSFRETEYSADSCPLNILIPKLETACDRACVIILSGARLELSNAVSLLDDVKTGLLSVTVAPFPES